MSRAHRDLSLRGLALAAAASAALLLAGAGGAAAQGVDEDAVAAKVGDETITMGEVQETFQGLPQQYRQRGFGAIYPMLLERMVQQRVLMQKGQAAGLGDDPEVEERMAELKRQVIHDVYLSRLVEKRVTDERLRKAYDRYLEQNPPKQETKARHILVDTEQQARDLIDQVTDGADFAELAREHSTGPSGKKGGDLGWFPRGSMVEAFDKAAFRLEPNQFTADPVKTRFGWHVILVEDRRTVEPPSFEKMKPQLLEQIGQEVAFRIAQDVVEKADVQRYGVDGDPMEAPDVEGVPNN